MVSRAVVALIVLALVRTLPASAQAQEPRTSVRPVAAFGATVDRIDPFARSLTLRTSEGLMHTVFVGPELALFDELKTGDLVTVRVTESVVVAVRPGAQPSAIAETTAAARQSRAGAQSDVLQQLKTVVTIESVDVATRMVVYKTATQLPNQNLTTIPAVNSACQTTFVFRAMKHAPGEQAMNLPSTSTKVANARPSRRTPSRGHGNSFTPPPAPSTNRSSLSPSAAYRVKPSMPVRNGRARPRPNSCRPPPCQ
jgi:hypothetical protein